MRPLPSHVRQKRLRLRHLGRPDEQGQTSTRGHEAGGDWEDRLKALDRAQRDDSEGGASQLLGPGCLYIDIGQCKRAGDFPQKRRLFVIGLDERERDRWRPNLDR